MDFYQTLENILTTQHPSEKIAAFKAFYREYHSVNIHYNKKNEIIHFEEPSYSGFCTIVSPRDVPKRKNYASREGKIFLLHAIAHIEYSAIDLALDAAYRFHGLPKAYYDDWLKVADDEVRHFEMMETLLLELGSNYGSVDVHNALFEASQRTQTLLERMAVVPRYLEANGLDATPEILAKLERQPQDAMLEKIQDALAIILEEEVDHVLKGDQWFEYACQKEGVDKSVYFEIIEKYYPRAFQKRQSLNIPARQEAGFSCNELNSISGSHVC